MCSRLQSRRGREIRKAMDDFVRARVSGVSEKERGGRDGRGEEKIVK